MVLVRGALISLVYTVFSRSLTVKLELEAIILTVSAFFHRQFRPVAVKKLDDMEAYALLTSALLMIAGQGLYVTGDMTAGSTGFKNAMYLMAVAAVVYVVMYILLGALLYKPPVDETDEVQMEEMTGNSTEYDTGVDFMEPKGDDDDEDDKLSKVIKTVRTVRDKYDTVLTVVAGVVALVCVIG